MTPGFSLEALPRLEQRPSVDLLAYTEMLALPMDELETLVDREVEQNPALERLEPLTCPVCGDARPRCSCNWRPRRAAVVVTAELDGVVADEPTAAETLLAELRPLMRPSEHRILEYLVGSLDHHGRCDAGVEEVSRRLSVSVEGVARVIGLMQRHGPAGVGASNLRECLLLQLDRLAAEGQEDGIAVARAIVDRHLDLFAARRYGALADALGARRDDVDGAAKLIRTRLRPYPLFDSAGGRRAAPRALPDVIVRSLGGGSEYAVELVEPGRVQVGVCAAYERLINDGAVGDGEIEAQVAHARAFLGRLQRRWQTLLAVAEVVVDRQREYVRGGPLHLAPLTRAEVANAVGIHESTASRAISGRFVLLPGGRLVAFSRFFERAQGPCAALTQLVAEESRPRSDAALAEELTRMGFPLSRRTVAKYRDRLGIPRHTER